MINMITRALYIAAWASAAASAATSGDFNVLSFNVAGLPSILNDNSVTRPRMLVLLAPYLQNMIMTLFMFKKTLRIMQ